MCKYFSKWSHLQFLSCRKKKEHPRNPSGQPHDNTLLSWRHHSHVFRTCKNLVLCVCVLWFWGVEVVRLWPGWRRDWWSCFPGSESSDAGPLSAHLHVDGGQISDIPLHTKSQPQRHTLKHKISPDFTLAPSVSPVNAFPSHSLLTASLWNNTKTQCRINPAVCSFSPERTKTAKKGPNPTVKKRWGERGGARQSRSRGWWVSIRENGLDGQLERVSSFRKSTSPAEIKPMMICTVSSGIKALL